MGGERNIRCVAAIGGLTVAVALLLTGSIAVKADELSDLRAQQQQLKQQLDEVQGLPAAPAETGSTAPAPTTQPPVTGGSFPRSFLIPGTDTSVSIGGLVQTNFGFGISH
jgi:hypothetical protein